MTFLNRPEVIAQHLTWGISALDTLVVLDITPIYIKTSGPSSKGVDLQD